MPKPQIHLFFMKIIYFPNLVIKIGNPQESRRDEENKSYGKGGGLITNICAAAEYFLSVSDL